MYILGGSSPSTESSDSKNSAHGSQKHVAGIGRGESKGGAGPAAFG